MIQGPHRRGPDPVGAGEARGIYDMPQLTQVGSQGCKQ